MEIFFSSIVKIRRTLVQLKQFKKIKHLQECNFPHFTSESKYQMKAHIWKYEMLHNIPVCTAFIFIWPKSKIIELPCQPLSPSSCWILRKLLDLSKWIWQIDKWISPSYCMDLSKWYMDWLYGFVKVAKWICFDCCMDLSKLLFVFLALFQTKPSWNLTKTCSLLKLLLWTKVVECLLGLLHFWHCFSSYKKIHIPFIYYKYMLCSYA